SDWLEMRARGTPPKVQLFGAPVSSRFRLLGAKFCRMCSSTNMLLLLRGSRPRYDGMLPVARVPVVLTPDSLSSDSCSGKVQKSLAQPRCVRRLDARQPSTSASSRNQSTG